MKTKILVTGAGGKTGSLVFQKLLESNHEGLQPFGLVRTMTSSKKLISKLLKQNSNIFDEDGGNGSKTSKENVIVGHKIPAGTGMRKYDDIIVGPKDEYNSLLINKEEEELNY